SKEVRLERCTVCNGVLAPYGPLGDDRRAGVPWDRVDAGLELYRCRDCDHVYWEGSHTDAVRRRLRAWAAVRPG
ncbi:MAG: Mut7-C RNAse domain-containing protein, partial [Thermoplasmata archaeon]